MEDVDISIIYEGIRDMQRRAWRADRGSRYRIYWMFAMMGGVVGGGGVYLLMLLVGS